MSSQFIQNHHTFYADFYTLRQYGLRIHNQCNFIGIAVIFTAHTLRRATLFPQGILFKIRADKQKKKNSARLTIINRVLISMNNRTTPKTWGGHLILCPPPSKSWGGTCPPRPPRDFRPWSIKNYSTESGYFSIILLLESYSITWYQ